MKSLQKEHKSLRKCVRLDLHTAGVSKNSQKYATDKSVEFWPFGPQNIKNRVFRFELFSVHLPLCQSAETRCSTVWPSFFCPQKVEKKPPSKVAQKYSKKNSPIAAQTAQTKEFLFQNVAYSSNVYKAGPFGIHL